MKISQSNMKDLSPDEYRKIIQIKDKRIFQLEKELSEAHSIIHKLTVSSTSKKTIVSQSISTKKRPKTQDMSKHIDARPLPPLLSESPHRKSFQRKTFKGKRRNSTMDRRYDQVYDKKWESLLDSFQPERIKDFVNEKTSKRYFIKHKSKDMDWANSVLDSNTPSEVVLSSTEIEHYLSKTSENTLSNEEYNLIYKKSLSCLDVLKKQLSLNETWMPIPPFSINAVRVLLKACNKLIRSRALTIRILNLIHMRENAMLKLMTEAKNEETCSEAYADIVKLSDDIEQTVVFWKHSGLPYSSFIYLGEDISCKIKDDLIRISNIYKLNGS